MSQSDGLGLSIAEKAPIVFGARPAAKTLIVRLADAAPSPERGLLINIACELFERIDKFLAAVEKQRQREKLASTVVEAFAGTDGGPELIRAVVDKFDKHTPSIPSVSGLATTEITSKLAAAGQSAQQQELVAELSDLIGRVEHFLSLAPNHRRQQLEQRRKEVYIAARAAEDELKRSMAHFNGTQSLINARVEVVTGWRQKLEDVRRPESAFPTPQEVNDYDQRRDAIAKELAVHEQRMGDLRVSLSAAQNAVYAAQREFAKVRGELQSIDMSLANLE